MPPVWASGYERTVAQPCTPATVCIGRIYRGADEEGVANEDTSVEAVKEDRSVEAVKEDRSVKMTDKGAVGGEAEVAKSKTTEVSETAATKVSETAATKVSETAATKVSETAATETTAMTKPHRRCLRRVRGNDTQKGSRARLDFRERQSGERKRRHSKLMLEHWSSPCATKTPAIRAAAGVTRNRCIWTE